MIPRVFHQIWLGPDPIPDDFLRYRDSWRNLHPSWQLLLWTEENLPEELRRPEVPDLLRSPVERSDILRFEVLWSFGGVYVDMDVECLKPIDELLDDCDFFCSYVGDTRMTGTIMGATPHHEITNALIEEVRPAAMYGYDKDGTGPPHVTRVVGQFPDAKVFDPDVFLPRADTERGSAFAVHHAARSWKDDAGLRKSLHRAEKRVQRAQREIDRLHHQLYAAQAELAVLRSASGRLRLRVAQTWVRVSRRLRSLGTRWRA